MNAPAFTTRTEAVYRLITEPIDASGEASANDYDVDAIADEILDLAIRVTHADRESGVYRAHPEGWTLKPEYDGEDGVEAFWSIVADNER